MLQLNEEEALLPLSLTPLRCRDIPMLRGTPEHALRAGEVRRTVSSYTLRYEEDRVGAKR